MNIAIIGTGNVGGALATNWSKKGNTINLGVQDKNYFKGQELLKNKNTSVYSINEAVAKSDVILIATPPTAIFEIIGQMGDVSEKIIIDATNAVMKSPEPYKTVYHALADKTNAEIVKCFNTTGFENMLNPTYNGEAVDMFMAGDNEKAKSVARQLALECGFDTCIDFGKSDKVELLEKFALSWINIAIMQGQGRDIAFKVVRR
ncbi:MAG: NAD(P)-binding domain-containing protein [Bacteroidetes bacterium]|nr:NAD(P)-binding domain-containing protein [Bacteroidota bacterium]